MDNNIDRLEKDLIAMQLEQLMTIKKELLHLQRISHFYSHNKNAPYAQTFENIENSIQNYIVYVSRIKTYMDEVYLDKKPYLFLAYHAYINKHINEVLGGLQSNNIQISQEYEEYLDQFSPRPYLSRRYSSKAISIFIEKQLNEILQKEDENLKTSIYWGYKNTYIMHDDAKMNEYKIETPFYYHELPYLVPNLFHELNHIRDSYRVEINVENRYEKLEKKIKMIICETSSKKVSSVGIENKIRIPEIDIGLAQEISADISACDILGASYVFSVFHTIVSNCFDEIFLEDNQNSIHEKFVDFFGKEFAQNTTLAKEYSGIFEVHLRLWIICTYVLGDDTFILDKETEDYLNTILHFMGYIFETDVSDINNIQKDTLLDSYMVEVPGISDGFLNQHEAFNYIFNKLIIPVSEHERIIYDLNINYEVVFNNIWKDRISNNDSIMHRNILRTEILKEVFPEENGGKNE